MPLSQLEEDMVGTLRRGLAVVTFCTCSFLIGAIVWFKKYRFPSSRLVLWLSVASAAQCIVYVMPYPKNDEILCDVQAFFISFFDWVIALWICIIAFNLHQSVVLKRRSSIEIEKWYHTVAWGLSFIVALLPFAGGRSVYGPSGAWCWIVKDQQAWRTGTWYIPLLVFFIYVITMYIWIVKTLFNEKTQSFYHREAEEEIRNKWKVSSKLSRYPLIFVILWILPIINRVENWWEDDDGIFVLVVLHTVCVSLQGTINSIVYCFDEDILKQCTPSGLKATIVTYASPDKRKTLELQKYQLQHDEEDDTVIRSIDLDPVPPPSEIITDTTTTSNNTSESIANDSNNAMLRSIDTLVVNVPLQDE